MRTHELAAALVQLASALKAAPDMEIGGLKDRLSQKASKRDQSAEAALSLTGMLALSKISKAEWRDLIEQWGLPITIPNTYSARDTIGKLLRYLEVNPQARDKLRKQSAVKASPELMQALQVLMGSSGP